METVLNAPGRALANEIKAIPTPGVTDQIMDRTKPVERATEFTAEKGMKALSGGGGRGDLERSTGAYSANELFVACIGSVASGEYHARSPRAGVPREVRIQVIDF
jgi:acetyl/propionyl-CoA carboxylase alpha subunit